MPELPSASILLPDFPAVEPLPGAVLFGFDDRAFPFAKHLETRLVPGQRPSSNAAALGSDLGPVHLDIEFDGVRADDGKLHAVYLGSAS